LVSSGYDCLSGPLVKGENSMTAKTCYNKQTAKFIAEIAENMPKISADVMQGWIENQKALKRALKNTFCPPPKS